MSLNQPDCYSDKKLLLQRLATDLQLVISQLHSFRPKVLIVIMAGSSIRPVPRVFEREPLAFDS